jgi:16S rRNA (adenine1518-N6/adenine1519-N6)-dimethyltransferase
VQSSCHVEKLFDLPPGAFHPPPKVHSSVIRLRPKADRPDAERHAAMLRVSASAFNQRRKMLRSSLKSLGADPKALCAAAGIVETARAEDLTVADFLRLADVWISQRRGTAR